MTLSRRDRSEFDAVNIGGLQSVLAAARARQIGRVVYTSSFLALPPADSPHVMTNVVVLYRVEEKTVQKIRVSSPDCELDAGGRSIQLKASRAQTR